MATPNQAVTEIQAAETERTVAAIQADTAVIEAQAAAAVATAEAETAIQEARAENADEIVEAENDLNEEDELKWLEEKFANVSQEVSQNRTLLETCQQMLSTIQSIVEQVLPLLTTIAATLTATPQPPSIPANSEETPPVNPTTVHASDEVVSQGESPKRKQRRKI